jgi:hypothetical protein
MATIPTTTTRITSRRLNDKLRSSIKNHPSPKVRNSDGYLTKVIQLELAPAKAAWSIYQSTRNRDGVFIYLQTVFDLVLKWRDRGDATETTCRALGRGNPNQRIPAEPFAAAIFCTSGPERIDGRTLSKYSRGLQYVACCKPETVSLKAFMAQTGGVNACASLLARRLKGSGARRMHETRRQRSGRSRP